MVIKTYYIDTCIWLNLWKEEGDPTKGIPYWLLAKNFIGKIIFSTDEEIIYTGFVLKEIKSKLNDDQLFQEKLEYLKKEPKFRFIVATSEDYDLARKLESDFGFGISFFDCMHIAIAQRLGAILVTRDRLLHDQAQKYISVDKPENLIT